MILGGGSNCQGCGCGGACPKCTRTCQNPHSGSAFQEVWRGYSFGAVDGRATDGYLTFSGDEDNPAFIPSGGPFHQEIGGTFYLDSSVSRFPCSLAVSFWRTLFPANASTDTALSSNTVTIACVTGQFMTNDGVLVNPGETYTFTAAVPLVGIFAGDPHSSTGTFGGYATCDGTMVGIRARIDWSSSERVHVLHGIVRECYEEGNPCATFCSGNPSPNALYLTLSGFSTSSGTLHASYPSGTYVIDRVPEFCNSYITPLEDCNGVTYSFGPFIPFVGVNHNWMTGYVGSENVFMGFGFRDSRGCCMSFLLRLNVPSLPCVSLTGVSGTASWSVQRGGFFAPVDDPCRVEENNDASGTLSWTISS